MPNMTGVYQVFHAPPPGGAADALSDWLEVAAVGKGGQIADGDAFVSEGVERGGENFHVVGNYDDAAGTIWLQDIRHGLEALSAASYSGTVITSGPTADDIVTAFSGTLHRLHFIWTPAGGWVASETSHSPFVAVKEGI